MTINLFNSSAKKEHTTGGTKRRGLGTRKAAQDIQAWMETAVELGAKKNNSEEQARME